MDDRQHEPGMEWDPQGHDHSPDRPTPAEDAGTAAADGNGAAGEVVADGGRRAAPGDGGAPELGQITYARSAPLPTVGEFEGYERVLPGSADRIVAMAEKSLASQVEDAQAIRRIEAGDHRAENISMVVASVAFSFLPWLAFILATVCALAGNGMMAAISGGVGIVTAGPQVIDSIKRKRG